MGRGTGVSVIFLLKTVTEYNFSDIGTLFKKDNPNNKTCFNIY